MANFFTIESMKKIASHRRIDVQIGNTLNAPCTGKVQKPQLSKKRENDSKRFRLDQMNREAENDGKPMISPESAINTGLIFQVSLCCC